MKAHGLDKIGAALGLLALALLAGWPLLSGGYPQGHDWIYELARAAEYRNALGDGQVPPVWAAYTNGGYGAPTFLYYAPLYSALTALMAAALGNVTHAATAALALLFLAAALTARRAARALVGEATAAARAAAWLAALLYILHPYAIGDALLRNASAEFAALALAPLALEGALTAPTRPLRGALLLAAGVAAVTLAHNLTALAVLSLALGLGAAAVAIPQRGADRRQGLLALGGGTLLGLALAAWFWVPALAYKGHLDLQRLASDKLDFHNNFQSFSALLWGEEFFAAGWLSALVAAAALGLRAAGKLAPGWLRSMLGVLLAGAAALLWLATPSSAVVWENLPLIELFQFPWRFVGPMALLLALAAAAALALWGHDRPEKQIRMAMALFFLLALISAARPWHESQPLPAGAAQRLEGALAPAFLRTGQIAVEFRDEYVVRGADPQAWRRDRPQPGRDPLLLSGAPVQVRGVRGSGVDTQMDLRVEALTQALLARYAFDGWQLSLDAQPLAWHASKGGLLQVELPAGDHLLRLEYQPPPLRSAMLGLSAVALALWLLLGLALLRQRSGRGEP